MELNYQYMQYNAAVDTEKVNRDKYNSFKERIKKFESVDTIEAARELAKQILPTSSEVNRFNVGNAKCIVINNKEMFRITLDNAEECICYDFVSNQE